AVKGGEPTYKYKLIGRCVVLDGTDKFICPGPCIKRRIDLSISVQTHNPVRSLAVEGSEISDQNELIVCHQHRPENIAVSARIELFRCFIKIIGRIQLPVGAQPNYLPHRAYVHRFMIACGTFIKEGSVLLKVPDNRDLFSLLCGGDIGIQNVAKSASVDGCHRIQGV